MTTLANSSFSELPAFEKIEENGKANRLITGYSLARHQEEFQKASVVYKTIRIKSDATVGFVILQLDPDTESIELKRIVVSQPGRGIGRQALGLVDLCCIREFKRSRVWLDVFDYNERAIHLYESCGYRKFSEKQFDSRKLFLYEKYPNKANISNQSVVAMSAKRRRHT